MSDPVSKKPLAVLSLALVLIAVAAGIYWFQGEPRKAGSAAPAMVQGQASASGITKAFSTGAMAAFLVKPERKPLPDIAFQDGTGGALKLGDWKGRVALVNLWATWCAPCRKEMPDLAKLQTELGSKDFEVVAISVDRKGVEASAAFLKETGAETLKLYVEPTSAILNDFQALGLPLTILVDRNGNEIGRLLGPADWASPEAVALIKAALAEGQPG